MSSDWKESSLKKRDFQHSKSEPEIPKHKKKAGKRKNTHVLIAKNYKWWNGKIEDFNLGKYENLKRAEDALKQQSNSCWLKDKCELVIEEIE